MRRFGEPAPAGWRERLQVERGVRGLAQVLRRLGPILLAVWFAWHTYDRISYFVALRLPVGIDAMIYHRAVVAWLQGGNPWDAVVVVGGWPYHYAGTPVTIMLMAPAGLLSEGAFTVAWLVLTWLATVWTLRRLRLPLWWLLFPPIAEALFSANPQLVVLALLLANRPAASALATGLKVYAFIPLVGEGRGRQISLALALYVATVVIAPGLWLDYIRQFVSISSRLEYESQQGGSAFYFPVLLGATLVALLILALRDRRAAGWLAVPAVWPSSQFHYSTMALPVMSPLLAVLLALPLSRMAPVAIILEVGRRLAGPWVARLVMSGARSLGAERPPPESSQ